MRILAISGSLRRDSHNTSLLRAAAELLPPGVELELWDGLRDVPPYDQDDDVEPAPPAVAALRAAVAGADAVLFATPEYNSSIPGALKNALDWASRPLATNAFRNKPVAVIGASTGLFGAVWAQAELRKVLAAMGARVVEGEVAVGHAGEKFDEDGQPRRRRTIREQLADALATLARRRSSRASRRLALGSAGGSSSASRRCTIARESTPTSFPSVDDRHALEVVLLEEGERLRRASMSRLDRRVRRLGDLAQRRRARVGPGATTSRTSVLRVITPRSRPSLEHEDGAHLRAASAPPPPPAPSRRPSSACGSVTIASRTRARSHSRSTLTGTSLAPRAPRRPRGCRRSARRSRSDMPSARRAPRRGRRRRRASRRAGGGSRRGPRTAGRGPAPTRSSETVTPPAFVSTSGSTGMPRSARIASAATEVGPFAPSTTSRQRRFAAFAAVT